MPDERAVPNAAIEGAERDREIRQKIRRLWNDFLWNGGWPVRPRIDYGEFSAMCDAIADFVLRDCAPLLRTPVPAGAAADDDVAAEKPVAVGEAATITSDHLRDLERAAAWLEDIQDMVLLPRSLRELKAALLRSAAASSPAPAVSEGAVEAEGRKIHGVTWLLIRHGCVLLEQCPKKARVLGVGEWFVPGGKIEGEETPLAALFREVREEWPGVRIIGTDPLPLIEGSPVPPGPRGLFLMRPYIIDVDGAVPSESSEGTPLRWATVAEALGSPVPQVRMMVAAAFPYVILRQQVGMTPPNANPVEPPPA